MMGQTKILPEIQPSGQKYVAQVAFFNYVNKTRLLGGTGNVNGMQISPLTVKKIHLKCQHEVGMQVVNNGQNLVNVVKERPLTSKTELYLMVSSVPANTVLCTLSSRKNLLAVSSLLVPKPRPKQRMSLLDSNLVNMYHRVSKVVAHYKNALHNEGTGIPQLVRFQLVRSPIQCGLQTALNSAIPRFTAGFFQKNSKNLLFFQKISNFEAKKINI